jgi:hypothetical protein
VESGGDGGWEEYFLSRLDGDYAGAGLSSGDTGARIDYQGCAVCRFSERATGRAEASDFQERRRIHDSWAAVCSQRADQAGTGFDFYAWRTGSSDAAGISLHGLLPQRLRGESILGEFGFCRLVGELPARRDVRARLPRSATQRLARGVGVQRCTGRSALFAEFADRRFASNRALDRTADF